MSQDEAAAIGRTFREVVTKYLALIQKVQDWQERVQRYQEAAPLDRAVREAVSRRWHMRRPEDVLEHMSQFRRSYGGMSPLLAPGDAEGQDEHSAGDNDDGFTRSKKGVIKTKRGPHSAVSL